MGSLRCAVATNMVAGFSPTVDDAVRLARANDVLVALPNVFKPFLGAMRAANPSLKVFAYLNGCFVDSSAASTFNSSWYLYDGSGRKVQSVQFGNLMMDTGNPSWVANRIVAASDCVLRSGYDGVMLDMMGPAPLEPGYLQSLPVDPRTGQVLTVDSLIVSNALLCSKVGESCHFPVLANGLSNGPRFFGVANTSRLLGGIAGGVFEAWLRASSVPLTRFPGEKVWLQNVNAVVSAEAAGRSVVAMTKTWVKGADPVLVGVWHKFAAASFLLASSGASTFSFSSDSSAAGILSVDPLGSLDLGVPVGGFLKVGGVYSRTFSRGLVLVNPFGGSVSVSLPGRFADSGGNVVGGSVVLAGNSGEIFVSV